MRVEAGHRQADETGERRAPGNLQRPQTEFMFGEMGLDLIGQGVAFIGRQWRREVLLHPRVAVESREGRAVGGGPAPQDRSFRSEIVRQRHDNRGAPHHIDDNLYSFALLVRSTIVAISSARARVTSSFRIISDSASANARRAVVVPTDAASGQPRSGPNAAASVPNRTFSGYCRSQSCMTAASCAGA